MSATTMSYGEVQQMHRALRMGQAVQRANALPLLREHLHEVGRVRGAANLLRTCEALVSERGIMVSVEPADDLAYSWQIGEGTPDALTSRWRDCQRAPLPGAPLVVAFRGCTSTSWPAGLTPLPDHVAHVLISLDALMACRGKPYMARALAAAVRECVRRLLISNGRTVAAVAAYEIGGIAVGFEESPVTSRIPAGGLHA